MATVDAMSAETIMIRDVPALFRIGIVVQNGFILTFILVLVQVHGAGAHIGETIAVDVSISRVVYQRSNAVFIKDLEDPSRQSCWSWKEQMAAKSAWAK